MNLCWEGIEAKRKTKIKASKEREKEEYKLKRSDRRKGEWEYFQEWEKSRM